MDSMLLRSNNNRSGYSFLSGKEPICEHNFSITTPCALSFSFFFYPIIHKVISNRSSPPARRAPGVFLLSNKCSVQSSVHPPPQRADSGHQLFPSHHFPRSSETFNGHSRVIGRVNLWPLVLTWTTRTRPSCPGNTSSTRPRGHCPRGAF